MKTFIQFIFESEHIKSAFFHERQAKEQQSYARSPRFTENIPHHKAQAKAHSLAARLHRKAEETKSEEMSKKAHQASNEANILSAKPNPYTQQRGIIK